MRGKREEVERIEKWEGRGGRSERIKVKGDDKGQGRFHKVKLE